jgi:hypothetical protein
MIRLILFRFWPAFLPLLVYYVWHRFAVRRAQKQGKPVPHFRDGPIYWMVIASLLVAVLCFAVMGFDMEAQRGEYVPPVIKDGAVLPGHVER